MPTTTNYGWTTPADTDLVKDGASAIRTLGSGVDTTVKNLNPETTLGDMHYASATANTNTRLPIGTTGQVLTVVGGVPAWSSETGDISEVQGGTGISVASGTGPIPVVTNTVATAFDAKGDLVVGTGADTFAKLTVGANNTVLTADSTTATGLKWATASSGGGMTLINTGGTTLTGASVTISSIPTGYNYLDLFIVSPRPATDTDAVQMRFNADTATRYARKSSFTNGQNVSFAETSFTICGDTDNGVNTSFIRVQIPSYDNTTIWKSFSSQAVAANPTTATNVDFFFYSGAYNQTGAISSITLFPATGNWTSGTAFLYGVK